MFDKLVVAWNKFENEMDSETKRYVERRIKLGKRNGDIFISFRIFLKNSERLNNFLKRFLVKLIDFTLCFPYGDEKFGTT